MLCSITASSRRFAPPKKWLFSMVTWGTKCAIRTRARSAGAEYRVATVQSAERVARRQLPVPSFHGSKDYIDWSLSSSSIKIIEVALNKILRKVWNLPRHSHTAIVHCVALVPTVCNLLYKRFCSLYSCALSSSSLLVKSIFNDCRQLVYTFSGYNHMSGHQHLRVFNDEDYNIASCITPLLWFIFTM